MQPLARAAATPALVALWLLSVFTPAEVAGSGLDPVVTINHGIQPRFIFRCTRFNENYRFGHSVAPVGTDRFVVGIPFMDRLVVDEWPDNCQYQDDAGELRIYDIEGNYIQTIDHPPRGFIFQIYTGDRFGSEVAAVGTEYFVASAPYVDANISDNQNTGAVYVYDLDGNRLAGRENPSPEQGDLFGFSLAGLGANEVLVGTPADNPGGLAFAGSVYHYAIQGNQLVELNHYTGEEQGDFFGISVGSTTHDHFVIGAYSHNNNQGAAYYYTSSNSPKKITGSDSVSGDRFGFATAGIGEGWFAVSAPNASVEVIGNQGPETFAGAGKVYVFDETGVEQRILSNPTPKSGELFGWKIAPFGTDRFLISASRKIHDNGTTAGAVFVYNIQGDLLCQIDNPDPDNLDDYGDSLAAVGDTHFFVGAPLDDTNQDNSGSGYIYHAPIEEVFVGNEVLKPDGLNLSLLPESGPEIEPADAALWHVASKKLYATKTGQLIVRWGQGANPSINQQFFVLWPEDPAMYQIHVAQTPSVDLSGGGTYATSLLMDQESGAGVSGENVDGEQVFLATGEGRSLVLLSTGNSPNSDPIFFQLVKTVAWSDPNHLHDNEPATIGEEVLDPMNYHDPDAGGPYIFWENSRYLPHSGRYSGYYDRGNRSGPVIPVNVDLEGTVEDDLVLVYYEKGQKLKDGNGNPAENNIYWPWKPVRFDGQWPGDPEKIIIANLDSDTRLAIDSVKHQDWDIYYQNDPDAPGFNPNDEHAVRRPWGAGEAIFPIRDDLGTPETSEPYVLMTYKDSEDNLKPKVKVFRVVAEEAPHFFVYGEDEQDPGDDIFAGTLIQAPFPLSVFQKAPDSYGVSGPYWRDRKLDFWAKAAGDDEGLSEIVMHFFYPVQIDFYFPPSYYDPQEGPPSPGTFIPLLDLNAGTPGTPTDVKYVIQWPDSPELNVAETLVKPKKGLPDISLQSSVEIIYQQAVALGQGPSVLLIDPTREHEVELLELPGDATVINQSGKFYFPTLPPQLRDRFTYDPINFKLEFRGAFVEPPAGESYLLLNVITDREKAILLDLSNDPAFQTAVNELAAAAATPVQVQPDSAGFDSLGLTAGFASGVGYVTLAFGNSATLTPEADPISLEVIKVICPLYRGEIKVIESANPFDEKLTLRHSGDFAGRTDEYIFEWRTLPPDPNTGLPSEAPPDQWAVFNPVPPTGEGAVDITIEGPGLLTLSDNYFICRYKPMDPNNPCGTGFSPWTDPMLAEGWIKRVLSGINPFEQRMASYQDSEVNTVVSMISQAGPRWVGNTPLNQQGAEAFGLIEIYETVFKRGTSLSIDGAPPVDYPPANDALLLVSGRLADLYMLLGNEAYADAADPTIAYGTDHGEYGSQASSIHCFMNQVPTLLEEELTLLRGRDDSKLPSIETYPVYNRFIWNFTGDINGGEVAYALNYNIRNENGDVSGTINEADAKELYPQGHGDAWGHYLTAIKNYYRLLKNPNFTWIPRIEAVIVGGVPVSVDFLDERKFVQAAAAKARTGAEIVNLTYRNRYVEDPENQFQGYQDSDPNRAWGLSEWASRAGQGALFDWAVGNALLPEKDNNPNHTGIQVVDRSTVTELRELPARFQDIQTELDMADIGLNPLGLAKNVVPFDIDPSAISSGKTHFDQIYERAVHAMNNAIAVFNHANNSTQLLRRQADAVSNFQQTVEDTEADFNSRLIEIFGYPYEDDIGPTGTYASDYDGPDIYHYTYVDPTELLGEDPPPIQELVLNVSELDVGSQGSLEVNNSQVTFHFSTTGFGLVKPASWTGQRRAPGEIQMARSDLLQTRARFEKLLLEYENLIQNIEDQSDLLQAVYNINNNEIEILNAGKAEVESLNERIAKAKKNQKTYQMAADIALWLGNAMAEALPTSAGLSIDATSAARSAIKAATTIEAEILKREANSFASKQQQHKEAKEIAALVTNIQLAKERHKKEARSHLVQLEQMIHQELPLRLEIFTMEEVLRQTGGRYLSVLARGQRLLEDRLRFRKQTAAQIQEYRYKDMAFRIFRNDALQKYRAQFDLAARYVFLAANAYDYETNLGEDDPRGPGQEFMTDIVRSRALGLVQNGIPLTGSGIGDPGLADPLARLFQNWNLVLKGQLGFNNPQTETGRFSLRHELFRIQAGFQGNENWRETLQRHVVANLFDLPEFQRFCIPFQPHLSVEPALVIPFATTINFGLNFFGWPAGGGDNDYDSTHFATKIRTVGVWFANYNNLGSGMINTPRVYLVPVGMDIMRSPSSSTGATREWRILDQALPVPFPLSAGDLQDPTWIPQNDTLAGGLADIRKYSRFRAYHDSGNFNTAETISDSRLIGRSVWNTRWLLIIPAGTLHNDREEGLARFIHGSLLPSGDRNGNGVTDIKIFFQTYAYSGN